MPGRAVCSLTAFCRLFLYFGWLLAKRSDGAARSALAVAFCFRDLRLAFGCTWDGYVRWVAWWLKACITCFPTSGGKKISSTEMKAQGQFLWVFRSWDSRALWVTFRPVRAF